MKEVEELLGFHKVNSSAYHPQTDGLVECFNRTLTSMLAKTVEVGGKDWDQRLPYVLFAYRASTPFFLLYGRDPRLPTDSLMCLPKAKKLVGLQEYGRGLAVKMSEAWDLARTCVGHAQRRQKQCYRQPFKWVIECSFLNLLRRQETLPISLHDHFMARFKWIPTLPGFVELTSHRRRIFWWLSTGSEDAQQRLQMNTGHQKKKRKTFKPMAEQEARNRAGTRGV